MSCRGTGFEPTSPLALKAEVRQLELDPALLRVLPPSLQDAWRHYSPAGQIDADVRLDYDGQDVAAAGLRELLERLVYALQVSLPAGSRPRNA